MRTTIAIEDGLLEEAKRQARARGTTLAEMVNESLKVGLLGLGSDKVMRQEGPLLTYGAGGVQPGVDLRHTAGLLEVMEEI